MSLFFQENFEMSLVFFSGHTIVMVLSVHKHKTQAQLNAKMAAPQLTVSRFRPEYISL